MARSKIAQTRQGERFIDGDIFLLCGRGTKEQMQREAMALRRSWQKVRVVSMTYYGNAEYKRLVDDYACYVCEPKPRA